MGGFSKSKWVVLGLVIIFLAFIVIFSVIQPYTQLPEGSVRKINRSWENPSKIDSLTIGSKMPGGPGDTTFAPHLKIPAGQKFYVSVAEPGTWCINEDCGVDGALIQTMGGWLQVEDTYQATDEEFFGLDLPENKHIKSLVIVGNHEGRIAGMFPNRGLKDVLFILRFYPNLANFNFLNGINKFGILKVGGTAPLKPGDSIKSNELDKFSVTKIPKNKKFYIFALQKRKYDDVGIDEPYENKYACILEVGCRYPEPDSAHDFLFEHIEKLGGWFLANDKNNSAMIKLFGLETENVLSGKSSLVALTDAEGIIIALHSGKTMSDAITILSQHPELVDVRKLYRE